MRYEKLCEVKIAYRFETLGSHVHGSSITFAMPRIFQGITEDDDEEEDSKAADEAEITGQAAPDKLRAELQRRKKEAEQ